MSDSNAELANRVAEACRFSLSDGKDETIAQVDVVEQGGVHWLTNLWVHPDHRGRGYARACLQRAIDRYGHLPLYLKIAPFTDQPVAADQLALLYADFGFLATAVPGVMSRSILKRGVMMEEQNTAPKQITAVIELLRGPDGRPADRETALAITKLEEALHWLQARKEKQE